MLQRMKTPCPLMVVLKQMLLMMVHFHSFWLESQTLKRSSRRKIPILMWVIWLHCYKKIIYNFDLNIFRCDFKILIFLRCYYNFFRSLLFFLSLKPVRQLRLLQAPYMYREKLRFEVEEFRTDKDVTVTKKEMDELYRDLDRSHPDVKDQLSYRRTRKLS